MSNDPYGNPSPWASQGGTPPFGQQPYPGAQPYPYGSPAQPPYAPGSPYPAPAQPYPTPAHPYPSAHQAQPYPAWQQYPPTQTYADPEPHGTQLDQSAPGAFSPYTSAPKATSARSPILGIASLVAICVLGAVLSVQCYRWGLDSNPILHDFDPTGTHWSNLPDDVATEIGVLGMPTLPVGTLGLAAWIIAIVATATKRGRWWGAAGICIGVIAPIVALVFLGAGMVATLG